jgi:exosortase
MATDISGSIPKSGLHAPSLWHQQPSKAKLWALAGATLVFGLAYAANFQDLVGIWRHEPNYSHGYLVIPIALYILWQRLSEPQPKSSSAAVPAPWWGWVFLVPVLVFRAYSYERNWQWSEEATIIPAIVCLTWSFGGWALLQRVWPAIAFLVFMLPLPLIVNDLIVMPLQLIAATGSTYLLQLLGIWVIQDGNALFINTPPPVHMVPLNVAEACSGLRMLMTMAATITAIIILIPLPTWKRVVMLLSVVPIAIFSNIIRIVATGLCHHYMTGKNIQDWAHDMSGWLMMPLALVLVLLELGILAWLVPNLGDQPADDDRKVVLRLLADQKGKKRGS